MSYVGIFLTENCSKNIMNLFKLPDDFDIIKEYHMTMYIGNLRNEDRKYVDKLQIIFATHYAFNEKVHAIKVNPVCVNSDNKIPHITLGVNRKIGGKPVMSNYLINWKPILPFILFGYVLEHN